MADVSITAANVAKGTGATVESGIAGETLTAGQPVYKKASDSKMYKADANVTTAEATTIGVTLHGSLAGQPIQYQKGGEITIGGTIAVGGTYVVSATAGGIAPIADLVSTNYLTYLGYARTAAILVLNIKVTGVALA